MRKLGLGEARRVGAWRLVPIELTVMEASPMNGWSGFYGTKEPYALCLVNADGACLALDTEGRDISVTDLLEKVPELREVLTDSVDPGFAGTSGDDSVSKS